MAENKKTKRTPKKQLKGKGARKSVVGNNSQKINISINSNNKGARRRSSTGSNARPQGGGFQFISVPQPFPVYQTAEPRTESARPIPIVETERDVKPTGQKAAAPLREQGVQTEVPVEAASKRLSSFGEPQAKRTRGHESGVKRMSDVFEEETIPTDNKREKGDQFVAQERKRAELRAKIVELGGSVDGAIRNNVSKMERLIKKLRKNKK